MHFKKKIQKKVYSLYLRGVPTEFIAVYLDLSQQDVDEIIDYLNEIFN